MIRVGDIVNLDNIMYLIAGIHYGYKDVLLFDTLSYKYNYLGLQFLTKFVAQNPDCLVSLRK